MALENISDENIEAFLGKGNRVLVFGTRWCADCTPYGTIVGLVDKWGGEQDADIKFGKVLLDDMSGSRKNIKNLIQNGPYSGVNEVVPYTYLYMDGRLVHGFENVRSHGYLRKAIREYFDIDIKARKLEEGRDYVLAPNVFVF